MLEQHAVDITRLYPSFGLGLILFGMITVFMLGPFLFGWGCLSFGIITKVKGSGGSAMGQRT